MGTGGGTASLPHSTTSQPLANTDAQVLMTPWLPAQLTSGQALQENTDSKIKLDELVPIYLILPESPGGRVCCFCTLPGLQQPPVQSSSERRAARSTSSTTHPLEEA